MYFAVLLLWVTDRTGRSGEGRRQNEPNEGGRVRAGKVGQRMNEGKGRTESRSTDGAQEDGRRARSRREEKGRETREDEVGTVSRRLTHEISCEYVHCFGFRRSKTTILGNF